jgi:ABC-type Fe3+/spermidine/putrescine transport system ATPase subunit
MLAGTEMIFSLPSTIRKGDDVTVAIRPERVHIASDQGSPAAIRGQILSEMYLGSKYEYLVKVEGGEFKIESVTQLEADNEVHLTFQPEHCAVFPSVQ